MNATHLASQYVHQPVLLLCGANDSFQPPAVAHAQQAALVAAESVAMRTFTAAEHADQRCQMGNLGLACEVVTAWLRDARPGAIDRA